MKKAQAITKYLRVSPTKARLAAGLIRGQFAEDAARQLVAAGSKGGRMLLKTLNSAVANAETQHNMKREELKVLEVMVNEGPRLKRAKARNKGGRSPILKRMSHFTVVVGA